PREPRRFACVRSRRREGQGRHFHRPHGAQRDRSLRRSGRSDRHRRRRDRGPRLQELARSDVARRGGPPPTTALRPGCGARRATGALMPIIKPYRGISPRIAEDAFIAENATLIGDVVIGPLASVWYGAVLRGDVGPITVGAGTNIQDLA